MIRTLGFLNLAKHRIKLIAAYLHLINSALYSAEPKARKLENAEIKKTLAMKVKRACTSRMGTAHDVGLEERGLATILN